MDRWITKILMWAFGFFNSPAEKEKISEVVPQNKLENYLKIIPGRDHENDSLMGLLLESKLYLPGNIIEEVGLEEESLSRLVFEEVMVSGQKMLPIFSSLACLHESMQSSQQYVALRGDVLLTGMMDSPVDICLNPGMQTQVIFSQNNIKHFMSHKALKSA